MSGLEVAGLAVGVVLPIVVEAIKAYSSTRKKIKTYRGYSNELHRLYRRLDVQRQNFLNECQLILREVVDDPEDMVDNVNHYAWRDRQLGQRLEERLLKNCESCVWIVENIQERLASIDEELGRFDVLRAEKLQNEPMKNTIRRVRKQVCIAFRKAELENQLQALKDLNADLMQIRSYLSEFKAQQREALGTISEAAGSTLTNLGLGNDICRHLQENVCEPRDGSEHCDHCLGYLELPQQSKHLFYCPGTPRIPSQPATQPRRASSMSVADVLQCLPAEQFELDQQLHLAHRLAVATLQFNSTPWLCDSWRTEDVFVLASNQPNMSTSILQTLHFQASCPTDIDERATPPKPNSPTSPTESPLELLYGIRNAPLFSLGVALLEVSQQRPLHFRGVNPENEVIAVRRLARGSMRLGPRYKEIVRRCLECDFGYGNDLGKSDLQSAVYGQVVCQLEEMMKKICLD
ncbi:hypothetical protein DBV05_g11614 [Lasiodiplodia theobromae]|uniref:DUF7580 domain-containing protein n=1 Tax=Lasiodiplodia theobromae TaxID=45133 RepID=A0A5N5CWH7_9PEZI|nr:hypothetical protein DBV05_g11614 [Lasiodiplodia theobromae]